MSIIKVLRGLGAIVDTEFEAINSGGCCVYASIVATELKKYGYKPQIKVSCNWRGVRERLDIAVLKKQVKNRYKMKDWNVAGLSFNHVFVAFEHDGKVFFHDCEKTTKAAKRFKGDVVHDGFITLGQASALAKVQHGWNRCFNRDQIPGMERVIVNYLRENIQKSVTKRSA